MITVQTKKPEKKYDWNANTDYRLHPEEYKIGKGEQGVLICEPYKSEILPDWQFKTKQLAQRSSDIIYSKFLAYLEAGEFVGADMARKYLQMGFTRARRYANYKSGKKYDSTDHSLLEKGTGEDEKAEAAFVFYKIWQKAEMNHVYKRMKKQWKEERG